MTTSTSQTLELISQLGICLDYDSGSQFPELLLSGGCDFARGKEHSFLNPLLFLLDLFHYNCELDRQ